MVPFKPLLIMLKLLSILYLGLIVSDNSDNFSCSRNAQVTFLQNPKLKTITFKHYKHRAKLLGYRCASGIVILAWRFAYSPFNIIHRCIVNGSFNESSNERLLNILLTCYHRFLINDILSTNFGSLIVNQKIEKILTVSKIG